MPKLTPARLARTRLIGLFILVALAGRAAPGIAQTGPRPPAAPQVILIRSAVYGEDRALWVWTPPGYSAKRPGMPILYVLDPDVHFQYATGLSGFLAYFLRAPEMIVVGVPTPSRIREFTPRPDSAGAVRGANKLLQFLTAEVEPKIRQSFNTAPFSVLAGHSAGGGFVVHTAFTRPKAFGAYIALSPALQSADSAGLKTARAALDRGDQLPAALYLGLAETESPPIAMTTRALRDTLRGSGRPMPRWTYAEFPGENHQTLTYVAMHAALRWLFEGWLQPIDVARMATERTIAPFEDHFARLSKQFQYNVQPAELFFSIIGDRLYQRQAFAEAITLFERRVSLYPESPEAHDELARGFQAAGRKADALRSFDRAVSLAEAQGHPALGAIRERRDRARAGGM